jgi:putative membrane protein
VPAATLRRLVPSRPTDRTRTLAANGLRGLLMGSFDVVPGVSGGTVALVVGIYERLIASIRAAVDSALALVRLDIARSRARLGEIDWWLVVPLVVGILIAIVSLARVIEPLLDEDTGSPIQARAVFFGLICGSLIVPWKRAGGLRGRRWVLAAIAAVAAFVLSGLPETEVSDPARIAVLGAAMIAICAMILPGISGAFILLALGMYAPTIAAVNDRDLGYLAVFAVGAAIGLAAFAKVLNRLLAHHHDATMAALLGLMVGALRALWPYQDADRGLEGPPGDASVVVEVALALGAFCLVTGGIAIARRSAGDLAVFGRPAAQPQAWASLESSPVGGPGSVRGAARRVPPIAREDAHDEQHYGDDQHPAERLDEEADAAEQQGQ